MAPGGGPLKPVAESAILPVTAVLPTRNVRERLTTHLQQMQHWSGFVREVIVVDSYSDDGTFQLIGELLRHPRLRILQHAPGLYDSWNHAIQQASSEYVYISTAGDSITLEGLRKLTSTASATAADVVVSPPEFIDSQRRRVRKKWPIHGFLESRQLRGPQVLDPWYVFVLSTVHAPEGVLGSSASNLYRTATLKRLPFPTDFGHVGDTAWAIANAFEISVAVLPETFSQFLIHPNAGMVSDEDNHLLVSKLLALAEQTVRRQIQKNGSSTRLALLLQSLLAVPALIKHLEVAQRQLDQTRAGFWPWILNPRAWIRRRRRGHQRQLLRRAKSDICHHADFDGFSQ